MVFFLQILRLMKCSPRLIVGIVALLMTQLSPMAEGNRRRRSKPPLKPTVSAKFTKPTLVSVRAKKIIFVPGLLRKKGKDDRPFHHHKTVFGSIVKGGTAIAPIDRTKSPAANRKALAQFVRQQGDGLLLVGASAGGLHIERALLDAPDIRPSIAGVVTIATPFLGAKSAATARRLRRQGATKDLMPKRLVSNQLLEALTPIGRMLHLGKHYRRLEALWHEVMLVSVGVYGDQVAHPDEVHLPAFYGAKRLNFFSTTKPEKNEVLGHDGLVMPDFSVHRQIGMFWDILDHAGLVNRHPW